jgi:hypothetical protein
LQEETDGITAQRITQSQSYDRQKSHDLPGCSRSGEFAGYDCPYGFLGCQAFGYALQRGCHWRTYLCRDLPGSSKLRQTAMATLAGLRSPDGRDLTTEMLDRARRPKDGAVFGCGGQRLDGQPTNPHLRGKCGAGLCHLSLRLKRRPHSEVRGRQPPAGGDGDAGSESNCRSASAGQ